MTASLHVLERGEGPAVVWIHGFPLSSQLFAQQLSIAGVRHIVPDLPGFGETPHRPWETLEEATSFVVAELNARDISRAVFAGVSMGGYLVLTIARLHPELLDGVILIDTRETADTAEARQRRLEQVAKIERDGAGFLVDDMLPKMFGRATNATNDELVRSTRSMMASTSTAGAISALKAMANRGDASDVLRRLAVPLLLINGSEDVITPPAEAERMRALVPHADLTLIEGAGHLANLERPGETNEAIASFLKALNERNS